MRFTLSLSFSFSVCVCAIKISWKNPFRAEKIFLVFFFLFVYIHFNLAFSKKAESIVVIQRFQCFNRKSEIWKMQRKQLPTIPLTWMLQMQISILYGSIGLWRRCFCSTHNVIF